MTATIGMRLVVVLVALAISMLRAAALEPLPVPLDRGAMELLPFVEFHRGVGAKLQVSTAPGPDGVVRRMEVPARLETTANWAVFALANPSDEQIDRLLVAPHGRLVGSGILGPDLGSVRIVGATSSQGFPPERLASQSADIYLLTIDPGAVVTYVLELSSPTIPQLRLWEENAYRDSVNAYTLYRGIVIGIAGLLALFFVVVFLIKGTLMFAATAALAWVVFGYVLIDLDFFAELALISSGQEPVFRAAAEVLLALALAVFVAAYLRLNRWHVSYRAGLLVTILVFLGLLALAIGQPVAAAGLARLALPLVAGIGFLLIAVNALRGYDRAVMLIPTWFLVIAWLAGAYLAVTGKVDNDIIQPALDGGLVLIVLLIGFTVMQHAFASSVLHGNPTDDARSTLALAGSGDVLWDWDIQRDRITTGPIAEQLLGLEPGTLDGPPQNWLAVIHPLDRERFRSSLDSLLEQRRGRIADIYRFRGVDGHFRWLRLRARPVIGSDGEIIRCVGTLTDFTEAKTVEERLLQDSVYDNLTGLPNRHLLLDRITMAMAWANATTAKRLFVAVVNLDKFGEINDELGQSVGDSALLTVARRLSRLQKPHDSLARLGGDSFGMLIYSNPAQLPAFIEEVRRQVGNPVEFAGRELSMTCSIGIAPVDLEIGNAAELLENAELAMRRAKRQGGDSGEVFDPLMRRLNMSGRTLARDLKKAIDNQQIKVEFRPIVALERGRVAAFEAVPSWHHPLQGPLAWPALLEVADRENLAGTLMLSALERSAETLVGWDRTAIEPFIYLAIPGPEPFRSDLVNDIKAIFARIRIEPGTLRLGVAERVIADNPEYALQMMRRLREAGAGIGLDRFGRNASWLAYLDRLPLDMIRFDDSLTLPGDKGRPPRILKPLVGLGRELGVSLIAGAVANATAAAELKELGFDLASGPLYGRPMSARDAGALITTQYATAAE